VFNRTEIVEQEMKADESAKVTEDNVVACEQHKIDLLVVEIATFAAGYFAAGTKKGKLFNKRN
jgi:hypothetical protein